jgi:hemoglobin
VIEPIGPPRRGPQQSVYDAVGGQPFFDELVARFYAGVANDARLRPLYPEDLSESARHLALFFGQYWGGPTTYSEERGHPALRMRHAPFAISEVERDAWLGHMAASLDALAAERGIDDAVRARVLEYVTGAADFLVNSR